MSGEDYVRKLWGLCMSRGNIRELAEIILEESQKSPKYTNACMTRVKAVMERKLKALSRKPRDRSEVSKIFKKLNEICIDSVLETLSRSSNERGRSRGRGQGQERKPERRPDDFAPADMGYTDCASVDDDYMITTKINPGAAVRTYDHYNNPNNRNMFLGGRQKPPTPDFSLDGSGEEIRRRKAMARMQEEAAARGYGQGGMQMGYGQGPPGFGQAPPSYGSDMGGYDQGGAFGGSGDAYGQAEPNPYQYLLGAGGPPPPMQHTVPGMPQGYGQPSYGQPGGYGQPGYGQPGGYGQMDDYQDQYRSGSRVSGQKAMALSADFNRMMAEREMDNQHLGIPSAQQNYGMSQGGYDQGYDQGYGQGGYDQGGYDQGYGGQGGYTYNPNI